MLSEQDVDQALESLVESGFVETVVENGETKYRITPLGLVVMFEHGGMGVLE